MKYLASFWQKFLQFIHLMLSCCITLCLSSRRGSVWGQDTYLLACLFLMILCDLLNLRRAPHPHRNIRFKKMSSTRRCIFQPEKTLEIHWLTCLEHLAQASGCFCRTLIGFASLLLVKMHDFNPRIVILRSSRELRREITFLGDNCYQKPKCRCLLKSPCEREVWAKMKRFLTIKIPR